MNTPPSPFNDAGEQLRLFLESVRDYAIFFLDPERRVVTWSTGAERILGYSAAEIVGHSADVIFLPEDRAAGAPENEAAKAAHTGRAEDERWHGRKDGSRFWASGVLTALRDDAGHLRGFCKMFRDLSAQKRTVDERDLLLTELQYLAAHARCLLWHGTLIQRGEGRFDWETDVLDLAAAQAFMPLELLPGERYTEAWYRHRLPEGQALTDAAWDEVLQTGQPSYNAEFGCRDKNGQVRWFEERVYVAPLPSAESAIQEASAPQEQQDQSAARRARVVGVAMDVTERRRTEQELRARVEREALLNRIGAAIRGTHDPEEVQAAAVALLGEAIGADRCYFNTYDPVRGVFRIGRDWHRPDLSSMAGEYALRANSDVYQDLYPAGRRTVVHDDVATSAALSAGTRASLERRQIRSFMGVVLSDSNGSVMASLRVAMTNGPRAWTPEEVAFVESVATLVRTALESARVQQRERNIAQTLQAALQPPAAPDLPGLALEGYYQPALQEAGVGGDFYDVFPFDKGCTALVVADLSGKGLAAASEVAIVRNMLRYAVYASGTTLAQAVTTLNHTLVEHHLLTGFATLFVALYDQNTHTLTYVNCGQEPGLVWRRATGQVEELCTTGPVLGGFTEVNGYEERTVVLSPGDVLALFTDGLTEAGPNRKELLAIAGVSTLLGACCATLRGSDGATAQAATSCLIQGVDAYARGGVRDDIALLVGVVQATAAADEVHAEENRASRA